MEVLPYTEILIQLSEDDAAYSNQSTSECLILRGPPKERKMVYVSNDLPGKGKGGVQRSFLVKVTCELKSGE